MIFGIVFLITFLIGFAFGLAMPFILLKSGIYKKDIQLKENEEPTTNAKDIIEEWQNGIRGE